MTAPGGFELASFLAKEREEADRALSRALDRLTPELPGSLEPAVRHAVLGDGKRLRPILCVSAYRAGGGTARRAAYDLGAAVELIHAYSLMHDDLPCMDDADLRRGRPTPHTLFGEEVAMWAGTVLIPAAALQAMDACARMGCAMDTTREVTRELLRAAGAGGMVGGQMLDLVGEGAAVSAERLDELHRRKTGALLTASLLMGGRAAGAPDRVLSGLEGYGRAVGLAFQIADDVLDATSSAEALGKKPSDNHLAKSTYVSEYGLDGARRRADEQLLLATGALDRAEIPSPPLQALARYIVQRTR